MRFSSTILAVLLLGKELTAALCTVLCCGLHVGLKLAAECSSQLNGAILDERLACYFASLLRRWFKERYGNAPQKAYADAYIDVA